MQAAQSYITLSFFRVPWEEPSSVPALYTLDNRHFASADWKYMVLWFKKNAHIAGRGGGDCVKNFQIKKCSRVLKIAEQKKAIVRSMGLFKIPWSLTGLFRGGRGLVWVMTFQCLRLAKLHLSFPGVHMSKLSHSWMPLAAPSHEEAQGWNPRGSKGMQRVRLS